MFVYQDGSWMCNEMSNYNFEPSQPEKMNVKDFSCNIILQESESSEAKRR